MGPVPSTLPHRETPMKSCPGCNTRVGDDQKKCPNCGKSLAKKSLGESGSGFAPALESPKLHASSVSEAEEIGLESSPEPEVVVEPEVDIAPLPIEETDTAVETALEPVEEEEPPPDTEVEVIPPPEVETEPLPAADVDAVAEVDVVPASEMEPEVDVVPVPEVEVGTPVEVAPDPSPEPSPLAQTVEASSMAMDSEKLIEVIAQDMRILGPGLGVYEENGQPAGVAYKTEVGTIDLLAQEEGGGLVVVMVGEGRKGGELVVEMLQRIGWIKKNLGMEDNTVRGIVLISQEPEDLGYSAAAVADTLTFKSYRMSLVLDDIQI